MGKTLFKYQKLNRQKIVKYGFVLRDEVYKKQIPVMNGEFSLDVSIKFPNIVETEMLDTQNSETYTLHLTNEAGTFVGQVRDEYEKILDDIAKNCFENDVFRSVQAKEIIGYIKKKYGDELEFLWEKSPDCAIIRRKESKKWYILFMIIKKDRLGFESDEDVEVINLHAKSEEVPKLLQKGNIYPAYHMNKKHWISIILDDSVDIVEIYKLLEVSYELAKK